MSDRRDASVELKGCAARGTPIVEVSPVSVNAHPAPRLAARRLAACLLLLPTLAGAQVSSEHCVPPGRWAAPGEATATPIAEQALLRELASMQAVLLGERHDSAEHHRWQLQTLAALHALRPQLAIGMEMFPRRLQPVLDRWVAGSLSEAEFLKQAEWDRIWRYDPQLYLPLLHFARMNRVPLLALNVERSLVRRVGAEGWQAVPPAEREGVGDPTRPSPDYVSWLRDSFDAHRRDAEPEREARFERFVESQLVWDRAMAEAIAVRARAADAPLVVGIVGAGHLVNGYGVPHQLRALGLERVRHLQPWDPAPCDGLVPGYADALFGLDAMAALAPPPQATLGVLLSETEGGVRIDRVLEGSVAAAAALRPGDWIRALAGREVKSVLEVSARVRRQPPGSWLPMAVERRGRTRLVLAKFPPES